MTTYAELAPRRLAPFTPRIPADPAFVARVRREMRDARERATATLPPRPRLIGPVVVAVEPRPHKDKRVPRKWTRDKIIEAIHRWVREHGIPPTGTDWKKMGPWWPCHTSVILVFGSWANGIEAAGYPRPRAGRPRVVASAP